MEHSCSQCGTTVEDGSPFCPNCHAPQIKVPVRPPTSPVSERLTPGTPDDVQPPAEPVLLERGQEHNQEQNQEHDREHEPEHAQEHMREESDPTPERFDFPGPGPGGAPRGAPPPQKLQRKAALHAAFVAGILAAVGTSIPVIPISLLCMFASGGMAVTLYRRRAGQPPVTAWMGAKLGVLSGGLGFGVVAMLPMLGLMSSGGRSQMRELFEANTKHAMESAASPQAAQAMEQLRGYIATDHGLVLMVLLFLAIAATFFLMFSALGGALGAALFGRDGARGQS
jgi:hypothetical protein